MLIQERHICLVERNNNNACNANLGSSTSDSFIIFFALSSHSTGSSHFLFCSGSSSYVLSTQAAHEHEAYKIM